MISQILSHTPLYVWGVLAALIALGLRQTRTRQLSWRAVVLPAVGFLLWSLSGAIGGFPAHPVFAVAAWGIGVAAGLALGMLRAGGKARYVPEADAYELRGSWRPMALILLTFSLKYAAAVTLSMVPMLGQQLGFVGLLALSYGTLSGLFASTAAALYRQRPHALRLQAATA